MAERSKHACAIEQGEFSLAGGNPQRSVWYQISAPAGAKARLTVTPTFATTDTIIMAAPGTELADSTIQFYGHRVGAGLADKLAFANCSASTETDFGNVGNQSTEAVRVSGSLHARYRRPAE